MLIDARTSMSTRPARSLRKLLADTRGLGRRDFIRALGQALAGSAILSSPAATDGRRRGGGAAGHRLRIRGRVEEIGHGRVRRAVHQEDRHPGCLPGPLHVREAARDARGQGHAGRRGFGAGRGNVPGQAHEHDHAARLQRHRPVGPGGAAIAPRQCHRRAHALARHLLQQKEVAGRSSSEILGGLLGRAEISRPPRAAARGGLDDRSGAQGRRREGQPNSIRSTSPACSAASTASSRTSRRGTPTTRRPSN